MNNIFLAVMGLSGGELILVAVVILVLFGAKKIPEFAKGLGLGIKEFKKASGDVQSELSRAMEEPPRPPTPTPAPPPSPAPAAVPPSQPAPSAKA